MDKNDGGPAFPFIGLDERNGQKIMSLYAQGMTLRDYFAAAALQGLCAKAGVSHLPPESNNTGTHDTRTSYQAYRYADAMLAERAK